MNKLLLPDDEIKTINILLEIEKTFIPKAEYVFRTFCSILGLKPRFYYEFCPEEIHVYYGTEREPQALITIYCHPETAQFFKERKVYEEAKVHLNLIQSDYIPFLFSQPGEITAPGKERAYIKKDIIASAFYFLSCWQEYGESNSVTENYRYNYTQSLQYLLNFADIPVVDRYCEIFRQALEIAFSTKIYCEIWPSGKKFALSLSHDIDYYGYGELRYHKPMIIYKKGRKTDGSSKIYKRIKYMFRWAFKSFYSAEKEFAKLVKNEKKKSANATYFLLSKRDDPDDRKNYLYRDRSSSQLKKILLESQVGLHGSETTAFNAEKLIQEKENYQKYFPEPQGFRAHFLFFEYQQFFRNLENAGLKYDTSLGYREHTGYRAGISYPFFPFNNDDNRPFNVLEIPFTVMDVTLISPLMMNLSVSAGRLHIRKLINEAFKNNGHVSILWHNNTFDFIDNRFWGKLYWQIIDFCQKNEGWVCSTDDMYNWWLKR